METRLHLCIVTQDSTVFERDVDYVNLPTTLGSIGVLANHAAMVCALADGRVRCTYENGGASEIDIGAGIAEVADNQVTLLVSDAKLKPDCSAAPGKPGAVRCFGRPVCPERRFCILAVQFDKNSGGNYCICTMVMVYSDI